MPFSRIFALLFAFLFLAHPLAAQDVFIKPQQPPGQKTPDLGIVPKPAEPKPQNDARVPEPPPVADPSQSVQPVVTAPTPPPQTFSDVGYSAQSVGNAQILKIPEDTRPLPQGSGGNVLSISVQPGGIGNYDRSVISTNLGLNQSEMQSSCFLEYEALAMFGETGESLPLRNAANASYRFNGPLKEIQFFPVIACRKIRTPLSGTIIEQNGYYKVGAMAASCKAGSKQGSASLIFRYLGDGQAQCQFN